MQSSSHSATDLLKKVRKIEIKTKALSHQIFAGEYHSAFKGRGMAFSEVREYQWGDDVRSMDWNVTARLRSPYVKVFEEERELTVVLLVDVSRSGLFGTAGGTKRERLAEIAAVPPKKSSAVRAAVEPKPKDEKGDRHDHPKEDKRLPQTRQEQQRNAASACHKTPLSCFSDGHGRRHFRRIMCGCFPRWRPSAAPDRGCAP